MKDWITMTKEQISQVGMELIPNADALVRRLSEEKDIAIGLLTGNSKGRSKAKLDAVGLWHYFSIGAYGDVTTVRSELVGIAIKDAEQKLGVVFEKKHVFVIGDTVRDVRCAKDGGVVSVAVATGDEDIETLKKENPDLVFEGFADIDLIVGAIVARI